MRKNLLPDKLRELRKAHNYTQEAVASALGVVRQTYSHYETGKRTPDTETLYKLAGFYDINVDDLMHLVISLNTDDYFDAPAPTQSSLYLAEFLEYTSEPYNTKKLSRLDASEKELLFYFEKLDKEDRKEILEFIKIKANKNKPELFMSI